MTDPWGRPRETLTWKEIPEPKKREHNLTLGGSHCNLDKRKDGLLAQDSRARYPKTWYQGKKELMSTWTTHKAGPEEDGGFGYIPCHPRLLGAQIKLCIRESVRTVEEMLSLFILSHTSHMS